MTFRFLGWHPTNQPSHTGQGCLFIFHLPLSACLCLRAAPSGLPDSRFAPQPCLLCCAIPLLHFMVPFYSFQFPSFSVNSCLWRPCPPVSLQETFIQRSRPCSTNTSSGWRGAQEILENQNLRPCSGSSGTDPVFSSWRKRCWLLKSNLITKPESPIVVSSPLFQ